MLLALAVAFVSVALGVVIGLGRTRTRQALGAVRTFALVAALATVALELLPGAAARGGVPALLTFLGAATLPWLFERLGARIGAGQSPALRLEMGYLALLVHHVGDGLGLGAYTSQAHGGHVHWDVLLSIGGHTVPVTAVVVLAFVRRTSRGLAAARGFGFALAIALGIVLARTIPVAAFELVEPFITAAVAGLLLHVATHDWLEDVPEGAPARLVDLAAAGAAIALVVASTAAHDHHGGAVHEAPDLVVASLAHIALRYAPALLAAAVLGALLGRSAPPRVSPGDGVVATLGAALLGATVGGSPNRAIGLARGLGPGRLSAAAVALALGATGISLETLASAANAFGPPFAGVWVLLAVVCATVVALVTRRARAAAPTVPPIAAPPLADASLAGHAHAHADPATGGGSSFIARPRLFDALEEAVARSGASVLAGVVGAAVLTVTLRDGALAPVSLPKLDVLLLPLAAFALGAPPLALVAPLLVLVDKGANAPAALAALAVAAATRRPVLTWARAPVGAGLLAVALAALVAFGLSWLQWPGSPARSRPPTTVNPIEAVCGVLLLTLALAGTWRRGVRPWLASGLGTPAHHHGPCFEESAGVSHDHHEAPSARPAGEGPASTGPASP